MGTQHKLMGAIHSSELVTMSSILQQFHWIRLAIKAEYSVPALPQLQTRLQSMKFLRQMQASLCSPSSPLSPACPSSALCHLASPTTSSDTNRIGHLPLGHCSQPHETERDYHTLALDR